MLRMTTTEIFRRNALYNLRPITFGLKFIFELSTKVSIEVFRGDKFKEVRVKSNLRQAARDQGQKRISKAGLSLLFINELSVPYPSLRGP